jgi:DNA mismatch repair protein MutL
MPDLGPSTHIKLLPEHLIDQIKAGEVVERPASLLKEIIENSVDAQASKIDLHIVDNGMELISLEDDGNGMSIADLPYAFCRHATSKIQRFEDIYSLHSYGFRGEALASIGAISRLTCVSTPKNNLENGGKIILHGGEEKSLTPHRGHAKGTSLFIKDLFYNTPARLKFIKSKVSEKNALVRIINSFILSNPNIAFSVKWDEKEKQFFPPVTEEELVKRVSQIIFKKSATDREVVYFEGDYEGHFIKGFASHFSSRGNAGKSQYLFANKRLFTDRPIHQAIIRGLEPIWGPGMTGHYCVMIDAPPNSVDVNVHPNKTQIKFFKQPIVYSLISASIKKALEQVQLPERENFHGSSFAPNQQSALFSTRENQNIDVQSFNISPFSNNSDLNEYQVQSNYSMQTEEGLLNFYHPLTNKYALISIRDGFQNHCLNTELLFGAAWLKYASKTFPLPEAELTPLLISEPFSFSKGNVDLFFPWLQELGFEFDRLEDDIIVLRTIPNYFNTINYKGALNSLLLFLDKKSNTDYQDLFEEYCLEECSLANELLSKLQLEELIEFVGIASLVQHKIITAFNNDSLELMFRSTNG